MATAARWYRRLPRPTAGTLASLFVGLVFLLSYVVYAGWRVGSDGHYSWLFARSLAFDGDLHFANDYALCGDPWNVGRDEGGGRPANPFYFGPALLWALPLRAARALVHLPPGATAAARAGCSGPLVDWSLALAPVCGALALWLAHRAARRYAGDRVAACALLAVGLCSPLWHYAAFITSYSHVWAALGVSVALWAWVRAVEREESRARWFVAGLAVGFAALMRAQSASFILVPGLWLLRSLVQRARERDRGGALRVVLAGVLALSGFLLVFSLQFAVYKVLYGHYWVIPQGRSYVKWGHGHPWLTLFAARGGLFTWHPLLYLVPVGIGVLVARSKTRAEALMLLVPCAFDVYVNSCTDWHGSASFGARRLVSLVGPMVLFAAAGLEWAWSHLRERPRALGAALAAAVVAPWALVNIGMSGAMQDGRLAYDGAVRAGDIYGEGLRTTMNQLEEHAGNPFAWPGALPFALRYRAPPRAWTTFTNGGYFDHGYRPVVLRGPDRVEFAHDNNRPAMLDGWTRRPDGVWLEAGVPARTLVELAWPYVTHVELVVFYAGPGDARVRLSVRGIALGTQVLSETVRSGAPRTVRVAVPAGAFDSGVNELTFEADKPVRVTSLRFEDTLRHDTSLR